MQMNSNILEKNLKSSSISFFLKKLFLGDIVQPCLLITFLMGL